MDQLGAAAEIGRQAMGAWPNGSRVREIESPSGADSLAIVLASVGPVRLNGRTCYVYLLEFDSLPGVPVCRPGERLELVK